jgi:hypothetical protein
MLIQFLFTETGGQLNKYYLKMETEPVSEQSYFKWETGQCIMSRILESILMYLLTNVQIIFKEECLTLFFRNWSAFFCSYQLCSLIALWWIWRMLSSGMLRRVAVVRTDVSEERLQNCSLENLNSYISVRCFYQNYQHSCKANDILVSESDILHRRKLTLL